MMVTFVSQCQKRALKRTRRVLDAFANRIGDNTWQTLITKAGLETVHKMLRKTASRSTAVSCHWIRGRSQSQLLWIVGNKRCFSHEGYVPVNFTEHDLLKADLENDWKYLPLISSIATLAALLHDWGKATKLFQCKLQSAGQSKPQPDPLRHEWISCVLFCALVHQSGDTDSAWLATLTKKQLQDKEDTLQNFVCEENSLSQLPSLPDAACLILWLILTHHRLPELSREARAPLQDRAYESPQEMLQKICPDWGYRNIPTSNLSDCFKFPAGLLSKSGLWVHKLSLAATSLSQNLHLVRLAMTEGSIRIVLHHARLSMMLGDHFVSSQGHDQGWQSELNLYANTEIIDGQYQMKQKLDEHLIRVSEAASNNVDLLPTLENDMPVISPIKALMGSPSTPTAFRWQDKAVSKIKENIHSQPTDSSGFFGINIASTGCGKTTGNAKIMQALREESGGLRFILALGLRTLTLQTGAEYRERLKLNDEQIAVLIGSQAIAALNRTTKKAINLNELENTHEQSGSESMEELSDPDTEVHWKGLLPEEELETILKKPKDREFLYAPILACTIDHLMAATETRRGGRFILPSLRLMSSDLVIDEIDDFTGGDLIAIGRLVFLAGMLGRKVLLSSATIPPDMAVGFFEAYQQGWLIHASHRNQSKQIHCLWVDEWRTKVEIIHGPSPSEDSYRSYHTKFIEMRLTSLSQVPPRRKARIETVAHPEPPDNLLHTYFQTIQKSLLQLHDAHHSLDPQTGKKVSFGVVRMANIQPCIKLTQFLLGAEWPKDYELRAMPYHSQQVLLMRHDQEKHLDTVLKRKNPQEVFSNELVRTHLTNSTASNYIFVLVSTPVEEIGRDHDFDWAVIEPSSIRSIIQMAGRVRRHRPEAVSEPNIAILQYNWKAYEGREDIVFRRPGYQTEKMESKDLLQLISPGLFAERVDASPRLAKKNNKPAPQSDLVDLEHTAIAKTFGYLQQCSSNKRRRRKQTEHGLYYPHLKGYTEGYWWLTGLPQMETPFRQSSPSISLYLVLDPQGYSTFEIYDPVSGWVSVQKLLGIKPMDLSPLQTKRLWLQRDYLQLLNEPSHDGDTPTLSRIYGEISMPIRDEVEGYLYNGNLGLFKS